MIFGGIDPGKDGALAIFTDSDVSRAYPLLMLPPMVKAKRARAVYDVTEVARVIEAFTASACLVALEWITPMPGQYGGVNANYERGYAQGLYQATLHVLEVAFILVRPQQWQRVMHEGTPGDDTKQKSIVAVKRLFPGVNLKPPGAKKDHDGFADALLLAEYARRVHGGRHGPDRKKPAGEADGPGGIGPGERAGAGDDRQD